jgi:hypothetical protein
MSFYVLAAGPGVLADAKEALRGSSFTSVQKKQGCPAR